MKNKKTINILVAIIVLFSLISASYGLFSKQGPGAREFKSLHDQTITLYGRGIYQNDSSSAALQAVTQDAVTLFAGIPLLLAALYLFNKGLLKGRLLLTGTLGYFLYTYTSYSFLAMYNSLFLIYVFLMSASFFAFTLMMMSFNIRDLSSNFSEKLPVRFIGGFLLFLAGVIFLMWIKLIASPLMNGTYPVQLEHYTTLTIQAMDLGFIVPASIIAGILIIKRRPFGYLLSSILIIKGITLLTAITAMIVVQILSGFSVSPVQMIVFPLFNIAVIYPLFVILKNVKETNLNAGRLKTL